MILVASFVCLQGDITIFDLIDIKLCIFLSGIFMTTKTPVRK